MWYTNFYRSKLRAALLSLNCSSYLDCYSSLLWSIRINLLHKTYSLYKNMIAMQCRELAYHNDVLVVSNSHFSVSHWNRLGSTYNKLSRNHLLE